MQRTLAQHLVGNRIGLVIEPLDTFFFRDGRPFSQADRGRSGLPTPQTLFGLVTTRLMELTGVAPRELHGLREGLSPHRWIRHIALEGPWLAALPAGAAGAAGTVGATGQGAAPERLFFPTPALLVKQDDVRTLQLPLAPVPPGHPDLPGWQPAVKDLRPMVLAGEPSLEKVKPVGGYVDQHGMRALLHAPDPAALGELEVYKDETLFGYEQRTGIGIEAERQVADDGQIYSAQHLRLGAFKAGDGAPPQRVVFYAELGFEALSDDELSRINLHSRLEAAFPAAGVVVPFGGEGRRALVRRVNPFGPWPDAPPLRDAPADAPYAGEFSVLISPVIFHPDSEKKRLVWQPHNHAKLVGALVPKPLAISGWKSAGGHDPEHGVPRPTRHAVPAGAVYFWQNGARQNGPDGPVDKPGPHQCLSEVNGERAAGWGTALRGVWRWRPLPASYTERELVR